MSNCLTITDHWYYNYSHGIKPANGCGTGRSVWRNFNNSTKRIYHFAACTVGHKKEEVADICSEIGAELPLPESVNDLVTLNELSCLNATGGLERVSLPVI